MSDDLYRCTHCDGSGVEPPPTGTPQIGAPSCLMCFGSGKSDGVRALQIINRIYGDRAAQAIPKAPEPAANGLEPGEIVAVPADLRNDPDGVQWECYFAGYWLPEVALNAILADN